MYKQSRYRWFSEDTINILTWHTVGQLEFTNTQHLMTLRRCIEKVGECVCIARTAMAEKLAEARKEIPDWDQLADELGMTRVECEAAVWFLTHTDLHERTTARQDVDVRRVLKFVPFRNPLLEAWELKQLVRVYEAAQDMAEDALCDLLEELLPSRDLAALAEASGSFSETGMRNRIRRAREARGEIGDPRRIPHQVF